MTRQAQQERSALCDTLSAVGPDAPTLCEGWATRDLAAHLIVRERRPDAAAGMLLPFLRGHGESVTRRLTSQDWARTVDTIRTGPPRWSPMSIGAVDELANLVEFFIHHEDVRRADDDTTPRDIPDALRRSLWSGLPRIAKLTLRKLPVGLVADAPEAGRRPLRGATGAHGTVVVSGEPEEILLFVYGRGAAATVTLDGADRDLEALRRSQLGI